jgi:nucleoside-diphosphate-sugar epimerase
MKFIITGHKGLIGKQLKNTLEKQGHEFVFGLDLRDKQNPLDIKKINSLGLDENIKKADIFFHLAANCKVNQCINNPKKAFENVLSVFEALEFCRKNNIKKFVYFSSSRILSHEKNPYTASKIYGEELCKSYKKCYDMDYLIIRPSSVYSPGQDPTNRLMDIWLNKAKNNQDLEIYGNKEKTLDFTYIDDFINGILLLLKKEKWNKEYNIATGKGENLYQVAKEIIKQTNSNSKIVFKNQEKQQPQKVEIDISEIKKLGYKPKTNIFQGIKKCLEQ